MEVAAPSIFVLGLWEMLILLGGSGGGIFGMPPGERDAALLAAAPGDALVYWEWASRGEGKADAPGVDGLVADPEIQQFFQSIKRVILSAAEKQGEEGSPETQVLARNVPPLAFILLERPGSLFAQFDQDKIQALAGEGEPLDTVTALKGLRITLVISGGDQADTIEKHIKQILQLLPPDARKDGLEHQLIPLPETDLKLEIHRHKDYFILGFGEGTVDAAIARFSENEDGLSKQERFSQAIKNVQFERTSCVSWIDVQGIVENSAKALGLQGAVVVSMAAMIGADAIDSIASASGVVDGQIRQKCFVTTGGKTDGILALAAGRGITSDDLVNIPADADLAVALSLSARKILAAVREIVGKADQGALENLNGMVKQLEGELGLSLEDDIFDAFGDVWTVYDSPSAGGIFLTSAVAGLEVRNPRKAYEVTSKLMAVLKQVLPGEMDNQYRRRAVFLAEQKFLDRTIYYLNTVGDDDMPLSPAFCVTDKQLLAAPHPQALKAHLRYLDREGENFASHLADNKELPEDGDLLCITHFDCRRLVRGIYAFAPYFGQIILSEVQSRTGGEIDIFSVPSARAVLPYISDSSSTVVRTKDGILLEGRNGVPMAGVLSVVPMAAGVALPFRFRMRAFGARPLGGPAGVRLGAPIRVQGVRAVPRINDKAAEEAQDATKAPKKADEKKKPEKNVPAKKVTGQGA